MVGSAAAAIEEDVEAARAARAVELGANLEEFPASAGRDSAAPAVSGGGGGGEVAEEVVVGGGRAVEGS